MKLSRIVKVWRREASAALKRRAVPCRPILEALEDRCLPALIVVTSTADSGAGSLRAAISAANTAGGDQMITFDPALAGQTILLETADPAGTAGPSAFEITDATGTITIQGFTGSQGVTIERDPAVPAAFRLFDVVPGASLALNNLTLEDGKAVGGTGGTGTGGGGGAAGLGGAIFNRGTLSVYASTLDGNTATGGDGGAFEATTYGGGGGGGLGGNGFDGDTPPGGGRGGNPNGGPPDGGSGGFGGGGAGGNNNGGGSGGFGGGGGGNTQFGGGPGGFGGGGGGSGGSGGTFGGRGDSGFGGGGGGAALGGAIFNYGGTLSVTNSTLTNNAVIAGQGGTTGAANGQALGGAIANVLGSATLVNDTIAFNSATLGTTKDGGAVFQADPFDSAVSLTLINTILSNSTADHDLVIADDSTLTGSNNLVMTSSGAIPTGAILLTADPQLGPLQDNGGPTSTRAIVAGSPPAGQGAFLPGVVPTVDQRGISRPTDLIDIGAFQIPQEMPLTPVTPTPTSNATSSSRIVVGLQINGFTVVQLIDPTTHKVVQTLVGFFPGVDQPAAMLGRLGTHGDARGLFFGPDGMTTPIVLQGLKMGSQTFSVNAFGPGIGLMLTSTSKQLSSSPDLRLLFATFFGVAPGGPEADAFANLFLFLGSF